MNGNKTLIAYATKSGVTGENAEIIAKVLQGQYELHVDIVNLKENSKPDLSQYDNIIIGSGIRIGMWYGKAKKLLKKNYDNKKVAIFLSSGMAGQPESYEEAISKFINKKLAKFPHIKPIATEAFGGRYKEDDWTDPEKVRVWAKELGKKLKA
ncbi:MAG: flavodoxin domain-containing protein [Promethearchaeota archaeon]|jgi:menaquinone-dependent protoporphyrinogen IX oxidase